MEIIYVYSTESLQYPKTVHKPEGDVYYKPWFKIGMTTQETADDRIIQQDRTANPEPLIKLYDLDIVKAGHTISAYELEQTIHRKLDRAGKRVRLKREWFELDGGIEEVKSLIESILDDTDLHKCELKLKPHQEEAIKKIKEVFQSNDKRCLLNHKPRSGKTFTTLYHIKEEGYKNVAILTSYPILNFQWEETFEDFKGFSNYKIHNVSGDKLSKVELDPDKNNIVLLSLQDVKGGEVIFEKEKFDLIKDIKWDLVIIDEIHMGYETQKTQIFMEKIKYERLLGLSATPGKNLICGSFTKEQTHTYTLVEENELKKKYPKIYPYADINFYIWSLIQEEKDNLKIFSDEDQFTMRKLFRIENDEFFYKSDLIYIFRKLIGDREICKRDKLGTLYPFKNQDVFSGVKSILMFVPSIDVQDKLIQLLDSLDTYKEDFNIFTTNSKIYSSKGLMNAIKREFLSKDNKRSLIIAVDQLTTGITLEDCDMVVMMNDWESMDKWIQASFRCQSPRLDKKNCFVLDLNPGRTYTMIWEYNHIISEVIGKSTEESLKSWFHCVNLFNRVEGGFEKLNFDSYNKEYNQYLFEKPRFNYSSVIKTENLEVVREQLINLNIGGGTTKTKIEGDVKKGKNQKIDKKGKGGEKKEISYTKLLEIAKALLDKTMLLSIFTYHKSDKIDECFKILENDLTPVTGLGELESKMFLDTLLVGIENTENIQLSDIKLIYNNIYDCSLINKKLYEFNQKIKKIKEGGVDMLEGYINLINDYLKPSTTEKRLLAEVFTPLDGPGGVREQLSLLEDDWWTEPSRKILDCSAGIGNYPVVIVEKLMKGLETWESDPEKRLKHILENMLYMVELQPKNMFILLMLLDPDNKYKLNIYRGDYLKCDVKNEFDIDKFDLITSNPPYQTNDGGGNGSSAKPIYNLFVEKSMNESENIIMITPSRWFSGGKGLDKYRKMMLNRKDIKNINHFDDACVIFGNNVSITGGVSYFLIDKSYNGLVLFDGENIDLSKRDVVISNNIINSILDKISNKKLKYFSESVLPRNPFNISSNYSNWCENGVNILTKDGIKIANTKDVIDKFNILNKYKLLVSKADGNAFKTKRYITNYKIAEPGVATIETYLVCGTFDNKKDAEIVGEYLLTKFARFLLSQRMSGQNNSKDKFSYIPVMDFSKHWTDQELYKYFDLSKDEIELIEKIIK